MVMKLKRTVDKKGVIRYYNPDIESLHHALVLRISSNGSITHWKNGSEHREDGPAMIFSNGDCWWKINGYWQRYGGLPPIVNADGTVKYWIQPAIFRPG